MERKEISSIAQEAASKVVISKRCLEKAYHIYEAHEYAHAASGAALKLDRGSAERYLNLMRHELFAADLPREKLEELGQDIVDAAHWIKEENKEAIYPLGRFLDKSKELMFQEVVACECGEAKAIEEKLGKEALAKILATEESNPGEYVTITDPDKTTFKVGEVVSREAFEKENERVKGLGEKPASGEVKA